MRSSGSPASAGSTKSCLADVCAPINAATSGALNPLSAKSVMIISAVMLAFAGNNASFGAGLLESFLPTTVLTVGPRGQETVA